MNSPGSLEGEVHADHELPDRRKRQELTLGEVRATTRLVDRGIDARVVRPGPQVAAREREAEAEAKATEMVSKAIAEGDGIEAERKFYGLMSL